MHPAGAGITRAAPATVASPASATAGSPPEGPPKSASARVSEGVSRRQALLLERYADFLRATVDWLWEADQNLAITHVSPQVARSLGMPAVRLIGKSLRELGRFDEEDDQHERAQAALAARQPFRDARFLISSANAGEVAVRLSGVPFYDQEYESFRGYRGTAVVEDAPPAGSTQSGDADLELLARTLEEALLRSHELAWRLARQGGGDNETVPPMGPGPTGASAAPMPDTFARTLDRTAHELKTPLNAVIGYAELGLGQIFGPLGERYVDCFRTIREAGRHLDDLVTQMRAKPPGAERPALRSEIVDIGAIVAKAKAMTALSAKAAAVDIGRVGPMAGGKILGDRLACTQILVNLLSNAIKFTPAGGSIGLETLVGPENQLHIVVWDTGVGIPLEEQERIFEPQYRASSGPAARGAPGFGLGLAISREFARAMGGDLTVSSQPGQGSRFILSLPVAGMPGP